MRRLETVIFTSAIRRAIPSYRLNDASFLFILAIDSLARRTDGPGPWPVLLLNRAIFLVGEAGIEPATLSLEG